MSRKDDKREMTNDITAFADQVMEGIPVNLAEDNNSLRGMQNVVVRMQQAGQSAVPNANTAAHIRRNLLRAWNEEQARKEQGWLGRLLNPGGGWQTQATRRRRFVTQMAFMALVILLAAGPLLGTEGNGLQGTASGDLGLLPLLLLGGFTLVGYWIWRRNK